MTATIGSTPFELVDDSASHPSAYKGQERRRSRPRVAVSDKLSEARSATWAVTLVRAILVVALWTVFVAPHLMDPSLLVVRTCVPLAYAVAELSGLTVVLNFLARLARAATRY
ncbi:MAG: hypothetical protein ACREL3_06385 [Gemmatimonadales bacterium]